MPKTVKPVDQNRESEFREATDPWSLPVLRFGNLTITVSYIVFVVAAIVSGVTLNETLSGSGTDAFRATAIAIGFWISGWFVQSLAYTSIASLIGSPVERLSIGLFGVRAIPRKWGASGALTVSLGSIASLVALGSLYRVIERGVQVQNLSIEPSSIWTAPSLGLTSIDSPWLAGAWLCWFQAIFQMFPLSYSLGRQTLGSLVAIIACNRGLDFQVRVLRACLTVVALATAGVAIWLFLSRNLSGWPIVMLLGVTIWVSSRAKDVVDVFIGFQQHAGESKHPGMRQRVGQVIRTYQGRRRSQQALQRERGEAVDAARLDEVLKQLHDHGVDSLSKEDRALLKRVSERVRKERDADNSAG